MTTSPELVGLRRRSEVSRAITPPMARRPTPTITVGQVLEPVNGRALVEVVWPATELAGAVVAVEVLGLFATITQTSLLFSCAEVSEPVRLASTTARSQILSPALAELGTV